MRHLGLLCLALGLACVLAGPFTPAQTPSNAEPGVALRGIVIPTGFQSNKYSAMIQIAVDGSPLPDATWDFDASFRLADRAAEDFSGRVIAGEPGTPVVFEVEVEFEPGSYTLDLTARETTAGQSGSRQLEGNWPDPNTKEATVSPIVLLQPVQGAFLRGENARRQGALALGVDDPIRTELPTALVGVVCRGTMLDRAKAAPSSDLQVYRKLRGASDVTFKKVELQQHGDQCLQVRDLIPAGTLGSGHFRYEIRLVTDSGVIATGTREFTAGGGRDALPGS